jgi:hypothetical protein
MKNIYVLPTDKPSRLTLLNGERLLFSKEDCELSKHKRCVNQHIYITSDEEIKEGINQWYLDKVLNKPYNSGGAQYSSNQNVIILTTDGDLIKDGIQAIDDEFLEWYVKNPSCEYIGIDLIPVNEFGSHITIDSYGFDKFIYKIIIPKELHICKYCGAETIQSDDECYAKPKKETLEEAAEKWVFETNGHKWSNNDDTGGDNYGSFIAGAKWQAEQIKHKISEAYERGLNALIPLIENLNKEITELKRKGI